MTAKSDPAQAVVIERTYNAPVEKVWKALTDVDQMRQWYFDLKQFKPEVGFEFSFVVEHKGNTYDHRCRDNHSVTPSASSTIFTASSLTPRTNRYSRRHQSMTRHSRQRDLTRVRISGATLAS